jgi:hypothetical protein
VRCDCRALVLAGADPAFHLRLPRRREPQPIGLERDEIIGPIVAIARIQARQRLHTLFASGTAEADGLGARRIDFSKPSAMPWPIDSRGRRPAAVPHAHRRRSVIAHHDRRRLER